MDFYAIKFCEHEGKIGIDLSAASSFNYFYFMDFNVFTSDY